MERKNRTLRSKGAKTTMSLVLALSLVPSSALEIASTQKYQTQELRQLKQVMQLPQHLEAAARALPGLPLPQSLLQPDFWGNCLARYNGWKYAGNQLLNVSAVPPRLKDRLHPCLLQLLRLFSSANILLAARKRGIRHSCLCLCCKVLVFFPYLTEWCFNKTAVLYCKKWQITMYDGVIYYFDKWWLNQRLDWTFQNVLNSCCNDLIKYCIESSILF